MLARTAQQGEIQIIFSLQNEVRCITRSLKQTKAGNDSVITHLYRVNRSVSEIGQQLAAIHGSSVILQDLLIVDLFQPYLEEISTTSQKEVENLIDDLLPSREVTLSSSVLLQDSDNIFEMTPATRITVFKQLFNLLDMDHARQQLADQKKTVQIRRQVLQENDDITSKFQRHLTALTDTIYELSQLSLPGEQLQNLLHQWLQQPLIQDL
ncbi:MAG: hypothetical protein Q8O99_00330 [bacterium]|nr:hypothetical protein [bacterium]